MKRNLLVTWRNHLKIILLLSLSLTIAVPVMNVAVSKSVDFGNHYQRALQLPAETTARPIGHVLFHAVVKVYLQLLPAASEEAIQMISILTFMLPLPVIIFLLLKKTSRGFLPDTVTGALALTLIVGAPITIWIGNPFMIGYISSIVYHNPTLLALRTFIIPLSIMSFWAINRRSYKDFNHRFFLLLGTAAVVMIATLSKPVTRLCYFRVCFCSQFGGD